MENASPDAIREQLSRILASQVFLVSARQQQLLTYLVEETLAERGDRVSQASIAIDVLGRDERFDPSVDSVVRVEAARLRSKLREYYEDLGAGDSVKISLPKGKYIPKFRYIAGGNDLDATVEIPADAKPLAESLAEQPLPGFKKRPAVAVLPFRDLSGGSRDPFLAEGLTEDIITGLSLFRWFPVIARNSSFAYRDGEVDVAHAARSLGARYVVEGTVRRGGDRIRVTAQLTDAQTGDNLWAQRFDRQIEDIFAVQDELSEAIVTQIAPEFQRAEIHRMETTGTEAFDAWEWTARGIAHFNRHTAKDNELARDCFEKASNLDSSYGRPLAWTGFTHQIDVVCGWVKDPNAAIASAVRASRAALNLEPNNSDAHAALALSLVYEHAYDEAIELAERAIELNPSNPYGHFSLGVASCWAGEFEEAIELIKTSLRLNPLEPMLGYYLNALSLPYLMLKYYDEAERIARRAIQAEPGVFRPYLRSAIARIRMGDQAGATAALAEAAQLGSFPLAYLSQTHPFRRDSDLNFIIEGLREAGWSG